MSAPYLFLSPRVCVCGGGALGKYERYGLTNFPDNPIPLTHASERAPHTPHLAFIRQPPSPPTSLPSRRMRMFSVELRHIRRCERFVIPHSTAHRVETRTVSASQSAAHLYTLICKCMCVCSCADALLPTRKHAHTDARAHARTHRRTHARMHTHIRM